MADRRLRRVVCLRGAIARRRSDPAGYPLSHRGAKEHRRAGDHARPRGPYRRADRPVAAAQGAALCHAVHRRLVRGQAAVGARRAANSGQSGAARRATEPRAVHGRFHQRRALDSGIQCAGDPHAGRHRAAYRRLEDRSDADPRPADRPGEIDRARRRGRAGAHRRFHQCGARRPLAVGSRRGAHARRADPHRAGPRRRDDVCLPCRAHPRRCRGGARRGPRSGFGRPRHGARHAGGARDRLSRRRAGFPQHGELRLSAARQGFGAVHRQPGRAARGAVAHRRGRASRGHAGQGRPRDLFLPRHSRQREGRGAGDQRPGQPRRRGHHRPHPSRPRLGPSAPRRACST